MNTKALTGCIFSQFGAVLTAFSPTIGTGGGVPGNVNGSATVLLNPAQLGTIWGAPNVATITNDINTKGWKDAPQVSSVYTNPNAMQGRIDGWTNGNSPYTNYTVNGTVGQYAMDVQIWELGNSLAYILGTAPRKEKDYTEDPGRYLLECYFNAVGRSQDIWWK